MTHPIPLQNLEFRHSRMVLYVGAQGVTLFVEVSKEQAV